MVPEELNSYITKAREQGMGDAEILSNLRSNGWKEADITAAMGTAITDSASPAVHTDRLLGPIELLKAGWARFKSRWQTALIVQIIPTAIFIVPALFYAGMRFNSPADFSSVFTNLGAFFVGIPLMLVGVVLMYWAQVAQYVLMSRSKKLTWKEAYLESRPYLWQYFAVSLIVGFATLAGFILFIVPGVIVSLMLAVVYPILFAENVKGFQALKRSRWYTYGYKVDILKIAGLYILFSFLLSIVIGIFDDVEVIGSVLNFALQVVMVPIGAAVVTVLYENLKSVPRKIEESQVGTGLFKGMFVAGLLIVPLLIVAVVSLSMYVLSQIGAPGNRMPDYEQYLPENYDTEMYEDFNEEEMNQQIEELNRMMQEYGMSPLPSAQDLPLEESSETI